MKRRGYTSVEVMISMTVFTIGAIGVLSMQRAAVFGNAEARKLDVANAIAREWVERLRADSNQWTLPSPSNPAGNNLASTRWLNLAGTGWVFPTRPTAQPAQGLSPAFDLLGRDLSTAEEAQTVFCTNVRLTTLVPNELIRAEIRVFWLRGLTTAPPAGGFCNAASNVNSDPSVTATAMNQYHFLYVTTAVRRNPAP